MTKAQLIGSIAMLISPFVIGFVIAWQLGSKEGMIVMSALVGSLVFAFGAANITSGTWFGR